MVCDALQRCDRHAPDLQVALLREIRALSTVNRDRVKMAVMSPQAVIPPQCTRCDDPSLVAMCESLLMTEGELHTWKQESFLVESRDDLLRRLQPLEAEVARRLSQAKESACMLNVFDEQGRSRSVVLQHQQRTVKATGAVPLKHLRVVIDAAVSSLQSDHDLATAGELVMQHIQVWRSKNSTQKQQIRLQRAPVGRPPKASS